MKYIDNPFVWLCEVKCFPNKTRKPCKTGETHEFSKKLKTSKKKSKSLNYAYLDDKRRTTTEHGTHVSYVVVISRVSSIYAYFSDFDFFDFSIFSKNRVFSRFCMIFVFLKSDISLQTVTKTRVFMLFNTNDGFR